ncbi:MAG: Tex family protein [Syntrophales bacterium]
MTETDHSDASRKIDIKSGVSEKHYPKVAAELKIQQSQVAATAKLLAEGATVPFIARYRKEATGTLDEVQIAEIRDRLEQLAELEKRREAILKSLAERELLTDELAGRIADAEALSALEDIYLPFRPKRRTRAMVAREKGLAPLAELIFAQGDCDPLAAAAPYVDPEKGVATVEEALAGARDIIAEIVNEDEKARARMRAFFAEKALFQSRVIEGKETEGSRYRDYFDWEEPAAKVPSHRILAMRRGEKEGFLTMRVVPPEAEAIALLAAMFVTGTGAASGQVSLAVEDSYRRLLGSAMETEIRAVTKKRADVEAIRVFADNLRQLLLAPPLGQKRILAIDPGFRTGCKVVCLDAQGKLLHHDVILPHLSENMRKVSSETMQSLCRRFRVEAIAIGNGTAGRETETFLRGLNLPETIQLFMVNESGASVYSASKIAREEFPSEDVTVRGAVSIGRRLADPLAELVKIDAKAIGVGQYQHDVDQGELKKSLDDAVMSCVNAVGVELNTASAALLGYVSGLGPALAANIVSWRDEHGPFAYRQSLLDVPRLGAKAFVQAAGFLRIRDGENPLDSSAVHPESYSVVEKMAADLDCTVSDLMRDEALRQKIELSRYVSDDIGLPTLNDILAELAKPGRDPRTQREEFHFAEGIEKMENLVPGMKLPGIVTNITAFGAFVDIGVHQDGLIHTSQLADRFVKDPSTVLKVGQMLEVSVLAVDLERKRISLTLKKNPDGAAKRPAERKSRDVAAPERNAKDDVRGGESLRKETGKVLSRGENKSRPHFTPDKKGDKKPLPEKRVEKIPFNNPFAAVFGKKE